jgi:hypothetical protein
VHNSPRPSAQVEEHAVISDRLQLPQVGADGVAEVALVQGRVVPLDTVQDTADGWPRSGLAEGPAHILR